jgi:hypothetical protein
MNLHFEKVNDEEVILAKVSFIPTWVQFINSKGSYDIKVLGVADALSGQLDPDPGLRSSDIARLKNVHARTTEILLGKSVPLSEMKAEYFIYRPK